MTTDSIIHKHNKRAMIQHQEEQFRFYINQSKTQMRLDQYILIELSLLGLKVSRTHIQKSMSKTKVNGLAIQKSYRTKYNDKIEYTLFPIKKFEDINCFTSRQQSSKSSIPIVFEDEDIIVINKPAGWVVHPAESYQGCTVVHALQSSLKAFEHNNGDYMNDRIRPGVVHRLDCITSGLMVLAKTHLAKQELIHAFQTRQIYKQYTAIVHGTIPLHSVWTEAIGRHPNRRTQWTCTNKAIQAKHAKTVMHRKKELRYQQQSYSLIELELITGRTHQIRVHASYHHHPILGDPVYSKHRGPFDQYGLALCSTKLRFQHPIHKTLVEFSIPFASNFLTILSQLTPS